jgi:hypothetical protein
MARDEKAKIGLFSFLVLIGLITSFAWFSNRRESGAREKESREAAESAVNAETTPRSSGTLLSLRRLIGSPIRQEGADAPRTSPECANFQSALLGLSLDQIEFPPRIGRLPSPAGCSSSSPRIAKMMKYFSDKCASAFESIPQDRATWDQKFPECQVATIMLRSTVAAESRPERPLSEITDLRELADLLVAQFGEFFTGLSPASAHELTAIADRMTELEPTLVPAAKAGAIGAIIEAAALRDEAKKGTGEAEKTDWSALENRVRRIEELNPNDPELDRYRRIVDTELMTPELVKKDSLARLAKNPRDGYEHELVAWANWRMGRREEARHALSDAIALRPKDPGLRKNWAVVNRRDSKPEDFKIEIKLGVGFDDLLK